MKSFRKHCSRKVEEQKQILASFLPRRFELYVCTHIYFKGGITGLVLKRNGKVLS